MAQFLLILNVKASAFLKNVTDFRLQSLLKNLSSLLIFGGVALGVFLLSRAATGYLLQQAHIGLFLFHRFLSMLLYVFFITVNLGNMIVCYATLYKSEEVTFLMGMPVPHRTIFAVKFIDNFFYSSSTLLLLGLALLLGYGSYFDMSPWFYFFTFAAVLLPFMLTAGVFAVIVLMVLIKVASRVGVRWLLAGIMIVYLSAIYLYFSAVNPVDLVQEVMKHYPDVNAYFGYLDPPFVRYLPNHWVSEFLYWTVSGEPARATWHLVTLFCILVTLLLTAWMVARLYYYASWVDASEARSPGSGRVGFLQVRFMEFGREGILSRPADVVLRRDFWGFFREPSQWLHLLLMFVLLLVFLVSMSSLELRLTQPFLQTISYLVVFLFDGFLIASISLRFVFPALSLEGDAFWCVRSAPVNLRKLYWQKFIASFLLIATTAEILSVASTSMLRDSPFLILVGSLSTAFVALGLTSLNLGAGAYFATFREKNPIRIASSQGASLTFLGGMVYLGAVVAILVVPLNRYFEILIIRGTTSPGWLAIPLVAVGILTAIVFAGSTVVGLATLRRDY
jgi:ABC-2 type transport system permease protein